MGKRRECGLFIRIDRRKQEFQTWKILKLRCDSQSNWVHLPGTRAVSSLQGASTFVYWLRSVSIILKCGLMLKCGLFSRIVWRNKEGNKYSRRGKTCNYAATRSPIGFTSRGLVRFPLYGGLAHV